jgi:hypothetical protein
MSKATDHRVESLRRFLLGLADLFELLVPTFREFARHLHTPKRNRKG